MQPDEPAGGTHDNPAGAALRADADAARAEVRAAGVTCPSCGTNMADLPGDHMLTLSGEEPYTARCAGGTLAPGGDLGWWERDERLLSLDALVAMRDAGFPEGAHVHGVDPAYA